MAVFRLQQDPGVVVCNQAERAVRSVHSLPHRQVHGVVAPGALWLPLPRGFPPQTLPSPSQGALGVACPFSPGQVSVRGQSRCVGTRHKVPLGTTQMVPFFYATFEKPGPVSPATLYVTFPCKSQTYLATQSKYIRRTLSCEATALDATFHGLETVAPRGRRSLVLKGE